MSDSEEPVCKKRKIEEVLHEDSPFATSLLHFPDDLLLIIFSLVEPPDLISLSNTCERFRSVSYDRSLWEHVDLRPGVTDADLLADIADFLQPSTKFLATRGPKHGSNCCHHSTTISKAFLMSVCGSCPNLKTLILEDHIFDSQKVTLEDFPPSLEQLGLVNCLIKNLPTEKSYFFRMEKSLPNLKKLDLSNNSWFIPHSLLALSKSTTLEHLILTGCELSDCLPYASLAANFGFSSLQVLDLSHTSVSDIEVTCFNRTTSLRHLYLCATDPRHSEGIVTDYSITTFGGGAREGHGPLNIERGVIIIEVGSIPRPVCKLETLVIKNYPGITDVTLRHAASYMKHLRHLDVTGTGCSELGIRDFKMKRPDVKIIPDIIT